MSTTRQLCSACRAEVRVRLDAQVVVCPVCGNINNYTHLTTNQYANYVNGTPGYMNVNNRYHQRPFPSPPQRQPPPRQLSPWAAGHGYYQPPPPPPPPPRSYNNVYYEQPLPIRSPRPVRIQSYQPQQLQTPTPHGSVGPSYTNDHYQPEVTPHQYSPHPTYNGPYYEQDSPPLEYYDDYNQAPSHPSSSSLTRPPYMSPPPRQSSHEYQQPLQTSQVQPSRLGSPPRVYTNGYHYQPSQPLALVQPRFSPPQVNNNSYYQQASQTPPLVSLPQLQNRQETSNGYYQQPRRTSPQTLSQSACQDTSTPPARVNSNNQQPSQQSAYTSQKPSNPPKYGRKRAVICGVSYRGQKTSLEGSINDAKSMKDFLVRHMRFPDSSIILLTEDETDPTRIPTRSNMQKALSWLVESCQPGDSLVFYYSGHGSRERDFDGDEIDGFDEMLCPVDYKTAGKISDDEINATIVRPLPPGAKLHAIVDTCFSGSIIDLSYLSRMNSKGETTWEDQRMEYAEYKGTSGGIAVSISACDDHQTSGDTTAFTGNSAGALTYSFIETMTKEPKLTYGRLLKSMRNKITEAQERLGQPPQEPQLSSSEKFDIHSKPIIL